MKEMNREKFDQEKKDLNDPAKPAWMPEDVESWDDRVQEEQFNLE